jgi:hypothetical protein
MLGLGLGFTCATGARCRRRRRPPQRRRQTVSKDGEWRRRDDTDRNTNSHITKRGRERGRGRRSGRRRERLVDGGKQIKVTGDDEVGRRGDSGAAKGEGEATRRGEDESGQRCGRCAAGGVEWIRVR